ncbi:DUF5677 domain-containing protein [Photobacterium damselae]|uniref:DUF5677 domain-containing protein n=1 Tax=Photobacterium damselae TaxID=38293 RepID=UPI003C6E262A
MPHKKEFLSLRKSAVLAFDTTYEVYVLDNEVDQIFYILTKKFLNHINSFSVILNGTNFNDIAENTSQIDHASAKVILRAAFETYLTISHLFFNDSESTEFRILLYKHSGFKDRIEKLPREWADSNTLKKICNEEETLRQLEYSIYDLGAKLGKDKTFIKNNLNKGWRSGKGWPKIGEESSLPTKYVKAVYSYLCGYSHSGYDSYMQLVSDEGLYFEDLERNQSMLYFKAALLLAYFCQSYVAFTTAKSNVSFESLSDVGDFLLKYKNIYS